MTYSSALFKDKQEVLSSAQINKYEAICKSLNLKEGDNVLEIGCGWGGFAEHAIKTRGINLTGLTLSKEQLNYSKKRMFEMGMAEKSSFLLQDYRDEKGLYDGVVSIEMFEAVGEKYWPVYFNTVKNSLKSGGLGCLQVITIDDKYFPHYRKSVDFLQKYIFPGGMLPSYAALTEQIRNADLEFIHSKEFGQSYSKTLRIWSQSFNTKWDNISQLGFDDRFRRMWNFYLTSCASFFFSGAGDVTQVTLKKN
jgi:cyclopropane-fatty-acyl-phospholipid synthase